MRIGRRAWCDRYLIVTATEDFFGNSGVASNADIETRWPFPKRVIDGGTSSNCSGAFVVQSYPTDLNGSSGWYGFVSKRSDAGRGIPVATLTVYAVCANGN